MGKNSAGEFYGQGHGQGAAHSVVGLRGTRAPPSKLHLSPWVTVLGFRSSSAAAWGPTSPRPFSFALARPPPPFLHGVLDPVDWIQSTGSSRLDPVAWIQSIGSNRLDPVDWIQPTDPVD